jgi:hypothetical protein
MQVDKRRINKAKWCCFTSFEDVPKLVLLVKIAGLGAAKNMEKPIYHNEETGC